MVLMLAMTACATAQVTSTGGQNMASARSEAYNGPKARIAVSRFTDKMSTTGYYRAEYGRGMQDMLTTALFHSNRYIVLERETLTDVITEQDLGASGRFKKETAPQIGELEGADLLIVAAITGFDPGTAGVEGSVGGFLNDTLGGAFAGLSGSYKSAHVAMDLRVVDSNTGRVVAATSVTGSAKSFGLGGTRSGPDMSGALGGFAKSPMETAIRKMIQAATDYIVSQTPQQFYRH